MCGPVILQHQCKRDDNNPVRSQRNDPKRSKRDTDCQERQYKRQILYMLPQYRPSGRKGQLKDTIRDDKTPD